MATPAQLFHKRLSDLSSDILDYALRHDTSDELIEEYVNRFDVVLRSVGWNESDLLDHIDRNWHSGD